MSATLPPARQSLPEVTRAGTDMPRISRIPMARQRARTHRPSAEVALLPNVLIPGTGHAGAAMLSADLGRHPEVCLPVNQRPGPFTPLRYGRPVHVHLHDYDRHFPAWAGQRYRLETSSGYLDGGRPMAEALDRRLPDLRVVVLLRDPVDRLWTGYTDQLARRRLPGAISFDSFVDRCLALRANGADLFEGNRHFRTFSSGFYAQHLSHWLDVFGDRLRVVFTEQLSEDREAGSRALLGWLGLDPAQRPVPGPARPTDGEPGYPAPEQAASSLNRRFWPVFPRMFPRSSAGAAPRPSDRGRSRVRDLYAAANGELADLLRARGMTGLPAWLSGPCAP